MKEKVLQIKLIKNKFNINKNFIQQGNQLNLMNIFVLPKHSYLNYIKSYGLRFAKSFETSQNNSVCKHFQRSLRKSSRFIGIMIFVR